MTQVTFTALRQSREKNGWKDECWDDCQKTRRGDGADV